MMRIQTLEFSLPPSDRPAAVTAVLRHSGWDPDALGGLGTVIEDVLMILDAKGGAPEVADYRRSTDPAEPPPGARPVRYYLPLGEAVVRAYIGE